MLLFSNEINEEFVIQKPVVIENNKKYIIMLLVLFIIIMLLTFKIINDKLEKKYFIQGQLKEEKNKNEFEMILQNKIESLESENKLLKAEKQKNYINLKQQETEYQTNMAIHNEQKEKLIQELEATYKKNIIIFEECIEKLKRERDDSLKNQEIFYKANIEELKKQKIQDIKEIIECYNKKTHLLEDSIKKLKQKKEKHYSLLDEQNKEIIKLRSLVTQAAKDMQLQQIEIFNILLGSTKVNYSYISNNNNNNNNNNSHDNSLCVIQTLHENSIKNFEKKLDYLYQFCVDFKKCFAELEDNIKLLTEKYLDNEGKEHFNYILLQHSKHIQILFSAINNIKN